MKPWIRTLALCGALLASWAAPSFAAAAPAASVSAASKADVSALPDATATARPDFVSSSCLCCSSSQKFVVVDMMVSFFLLRFPPEGPAAHANTIVGKFSFKKSIKESQPLGKRGFDYKFRFVSVQSAQICSISMTYF